MGWVLCHHRVPWELPDPALEGTRAPSKMGRNSCISQKGFERQGKHQGSARMGGALTPQKPQRDPPKIPQGGWAHLERGCAHPDGARVAEEGEVPVGEGHGHVQERPRRGAQPRGALQGQGGHRGTAMGPQSDPQGTWAEQGGPFLPAQPSDLFLTLGPGRVGRRGGREMVGTGSVHGMGKDLGASQGTGEGPGDIPRVSGDSRTIPNVLTTTEQEVLSSRKSSCPMASSTTVTLSWDSTAQHGGGFCRPGDRGHRGTDGH